MRTAEIATHIDRAQTAMKAAHFTAFNSARATHLNVAKAELELALAGITAQLQALATSGVTK